MKSPSMFKMYDIRTKHQNLSAQDADRLIAAIARYYKETLGVRGVVLARDARLYCARLLDRAVELLPQFGLEVLFNPVPISTCQFYFSCMRNRALGGIMITASHNPSEYIGFKLVGPELFPIAMGCGPEGGLQQVQRFYAEDLPLPQTDAPAKVRVVQYQREYVSYSLRLAGVRPGDLSGMRVFAEFLSGAAGADFALAMQEAGADCTLSHPVPDGFFLHGSPNPIEEPSIAPAREKVRAGRYDLGFCFDGDGDRMDLMYPDGSQVIPGLNMSLLIPHIREIFRPKFPEGFPVKAYVDVKAIPLSLIEIARAGIEPHIIRNGHSFIKLKLREHLEEGYLVSEEESSHYYMNFPYDPDDLSQGFAAAENTLFFSLLTLKALKEDPAGYARIRQLQNGIFRYREWPLYFTDGDAMPQVMQDVESAMRARGAAVLTQMDDGSELDATLMRFSLPAHIGADTAFPEVWAQVAQRISRSEDAMTRWEVVASGPELCKEINDVIRAIADDYIARGLAHD